MAEVEEIQSREVLFVSRTNGGGGAVDPESPLVCAAVAAGFAWADETPFLDYVERVDGVETRTTAWALLKGEVEVDGERLDFAEFRRRFEDEEWVEANRHSTIGRLHYATHGLHLFHQGIFRDGPHVRITNGLLFAQIPPWAGDDEIRETVRELMG